ncbi:MAG TPA: hypothetical protein VHN39_06480, partial [Phenylobacterium sp.]|nr:hypothetical protein [Phenylobacterium sp.]
SLQGGRRRAEFDPGSMAEPPVVRVLRLASTCERGAALGSDTSRSRGGRRPYESFIFLLESLTRPDGQAGG